MSLPGLAVTVLTALDPSHPSSAAADVAGLTAALGEIPGWSVGTEGLTAAALRAPRPAGAVLVLLAERRPDAEIEEALGELRTPWLALGPTLAAYGHLGVLAEATGVVTGEVTPCHEMRVRPGAGDIAAEVTARMGGTLTVPGQWPLAQKVTDDVAVVLTANWQLRDLPVATLRAAPVPVATCTLGSVAGVLARRDVVRIVHRLLRTLAGQRDPAPVRVGMLGFGAVGAEHLTAITATTGLVLTAVCDRAPERLTAAARLAPGAAAVNDAEELLRRPDVDLVIVSTPPSAHAGWARRVAEGGRHVLVEKPFALTVAEADAVLDAAAGSGVVAASYQNRRFDSDYLALARAVRSGRLGEVFGYDSFVGGYQHPCNYWHSDASVSGGAHYDWGSHYVDWMLDLFPQPVSSVNMQVHKRVWHDVTNADHARLRVRFRDGLEAEFTHSDLAAATKPKWHVLGSAGALVGDWRQERVIARTLVGTLAEDVLALADSPAELTLYRADDEGQVERTSLPLAVAPEFPLHRDLADVVLTGLPPRVRVEQSRRVVSVLEAATRSAEAGGVDVTPEIS